MFIALCISAVAIYYSVAGLVAIFAAAAIPTGLIIEASKANPLLHPPRNEARYSTYIIIRAGSDADPFLTYTHPYYTSRTTGTSRRDVALSRV